jgi:hypothetical protein
MIALPKEVNGSFVTSRDARMCAAVTAAEDEPIESVTSTEDDMGARWTRLRLMMLPAKTEQFAVARFTAASAATDDEVPVSAAFTFLISTHERVRLSAQANVSRSRTPTAGWTIESANAAPVALWATIRITTGRGDAQISSWSDDVIREGLADTVVAAAALVSVEVDTILDWLWLVNGRVDSVLVAEIVWALVDVVVALALELALPLGVALNNGLEKVARLGLSEGVGDCVVDIDEEEAQNDCVGVEHAVPDGTVDNITLDGVDVTSDDKAELVQLNVTDRLFE